MTVCGRGRVHFGAQALSVSRDGVGGWDMLVPLTLLGAGIGEQHRRIAENQRRKELLLDLGEELHLRDRDAGTLGYRRYLRSPGVDRSR
jgi:hypothetical protein